MKNLLAKLFINTGKKCIDIAMKLDPENQGEYLESRPVQSIDELRKILDDMGLQNVPIVEVGQNKISKPTYDFLH